MYTNLDVVLRDMINDSFSSTKADVAAFFKVGLRTVENWMQRGRIPYVRIGKVVRFNLGDVAKHVEQKYLVRARQRPLRSNLMPQEER